MLAPLRYIKNNQIQRGDFAETLEKFSSFFTWTEDECDVLDVGCGTGDATKDVLLPSLKCRRARIVGVDASQAMVEFACANCQLSDLDFQLMDVATHKDPRDIFPNGFDKIYSSYCLHWVNDQRRAIKNMYDLLKANGEIFLLFITQTVNFTAEKKVISKEKWAKYLKDSPIVSLAYEKSKQPAEELRRYMEDAGFTVLSCELLDKVVVFPSRDDFKEFLTSVSAYQKVIPEEKMDEFISEVLDELPNAEQEDGSFHKNFKTLQAFARK